MRYHWGLGVGHVYGQTPSQPDDRSHDEDPASEDDGDLDEDPDIGPDTEHAENQEYDHIQGSETDSSDGSVESEDSDCGGSDLFELNEMYGDSQNIDFYD